MSDINTFPTTLGFGKLNPESISENENEISAKYLFTDQAIHQVIYKKKQDSWIIKDIINGQGSFSGGKSLKQATLIHFNSLDCSTDLTFKSVEEKVCNLGNIFFQYFLSQTDKGGAISYYPAGKLVVFRLPVLPEFFEKNNPEDNEPYLRPNHIYDSIILLTKKNGDKQIIPIHIIEYLMPLSLIYEMAEWLSVNNYISPEKIFRMIIQDIPHKVGNTFLDFLGTENDDYLKYTLLFEGMGSQANEFSNFKERLRSSFLHN